jgi:hypothetical protein
VHAAPKAGRCRSVMTEIRAAAYPDQARSDGRGRGAAVVTACLAASTTAGASDALPCRNRRGGRGVVRRMEPPRCSLRLPARHCVGCCRCLSAHWLCRCYAEQSEQVSYPAESERINDQAGPLWQPNKLRCRTGNDWSGPLDLWMRGNRGAFDHAQLTAHRRGAARHSNRCLHSHSKLTYSHVKPVAARRTPVAEPSRADHPLEGSAQGGTSWN